MTDDISNVVLKPCPFCGGRAERIDFGPGSGDNEGGSCISCTVCQSSGPVEYGRKENFVSTWNRRLESAIPPAEVDGVLKSLRDARLYVTHAHCSITLPEGFVERYDAAISAVAALAHQLSASEALLAEARAEIERLNGVVECKTIDANERGNALTASAETKRDLKAKLAEATRRLGEVEGLLQEWLDADHAGWIDPLIDRTEAALTKEPTK